MGNYRVQKILTFTMQAPKPSPGPHKSRESIPMAILLRNRLKYALTYDEVKKICMQRLVKVDGKVRTDKTFPCGFQGKLAVCGQCVQTSLLQRILWYESGFCTRWSQARSFCVLEGWQQLDEMVGRYPRLNGPFLVVVEWWHVWCSMLICGFGIWGHVFVSWLLMIACFDKV